MKNKNIKVFVGMSGGVDSSVTALLLQKEGYELVGCFIKGWYPDGMSCGWREDRRDAMRVCAKLGIPFITIDGEKAYKKKVVDYMLREYKAGRTPNPDVMCNKNVKFGIFLKEALRLGADYVATGHYIRLRRNRRGKRSFHEEESHRTTERGATLRSNRHTLKIAKDLNKDQSYFLWTLTQKQLKHCMFPLGDIIKPEVRALAKKHKLITAKKKDSQGVCFLGEFDMKEFLKRYIKPKKGNIVTPDGKKVGEHEGVLFYTIGQRHGFNIGGGMPYYVVDKDVKKNILVVAGEKDEKKFRKKEIKITDASWITGETPDTEKRYKARIRYRQPLQNCEIKKIEGRKWKVVFKKAQRAVTSGQSLVIYDNRGVMLGGGIIE